MKYLLTLLVSCLLLACGGGAGGGDTKVTCASFTYQEDAQAHYQKSLDRDNDGIACEDLPHRPTVSTPPVSTPVTPPTPGSEMQSISFTDTLARNPMVQLLSNSTYNLSVSAFVTPIGTQVGPIIINPDGSTRLGTNSGYQYQTINGGLVLSYFNQSLYGSQGMGFINNGGVALSSLPGDYRLMGRSCAADTGDNCVLTYGSAKINSSGVFRYCPAANYSDTCAQGIQFQIGATLSTNGLFPFTPVAATYGGLTTGNNPANGIAVNMSIASRYYSLFGQLATYTVAPASTYSNTEFIPNGIGTVTSTQTFAGLTNDAPIIGFSTTSDGNIYLNNSSGFLITGRDAQAGKSAQLKFSKVSP